MEEKKAIFPHPQAENLPHYQQIEYTFDLICPIMSNSEILINCIGKNCAKFDECFKENNYNRILTKGFVMLFTFLQMLIFIALMIK